MSLVINTNVASLNSQRQLMNSGGALDKSTERLSSGQRINSAKDDAAGLAISNRMTSQVRGLDQAIRNANDGISLIQTAEGALQEVTNILQRARELAIQSANGIYSDADRSQLNAETQQLKSELNRIASSTSFNGQNLLDGSLGKTDLQVGSEANQTIGITVPSFNTDKLGGASGDITGKATTIASLNALVATTWTVNDTPIASLAAAVTVNDAIKIINNSLDGKGALASASVEYKAPSVGTGVLVAGVNVLTIAVKDGDGNTQTYKLTGTNSMEELVKKINAETGVEAKLNDSGRLVLDKQGAESIIVTDSSTGNAASGFGAGPSTGTFSLVISDTSVGKNGVKIETDGTAGTDALLIAAGLDPQNDTNDLQGASLTAAAGVSNDGDIIINGVSIKAVTFTGTATTDVTAVIKQLNLQSSETGVVASLGTWADGAAAAATDAIQLTSVSGSDISIKYGTNAVAATNLARFGFIERNAADGTGSINNIDISTAAGAQKAIAVIDKAIDQVSSTRSQMGAINNRLEFTINNLANVSEKTSAARSRIVDADFAAETAALSRSQVLQQAATAMLAQSNARPQQVLSLLK